VDSETTLRKIMPQYWELSSLFQRDSQRPVRLQQSNKMKQSTSTEGLFTMGRFREKSATEMKYFLLPKTLHSIL